MRSLIVSFSGIDGAGKSAIIARYQSALSEYSIPSVCIWLRYPHYLTKPLLGLCRLLGLTWYDREDPRVGYHEFYRSSLISSVYIVLKFLDLLGATLLRVYLPGMLKRQIIIVDRWIPDVLVDISIDTNKDLQPLPFWARCFLRLIPEKRVRCLVVQRDMDAVLKARDENGRDRNFSKRYSAYAQFAEFPRVMTLDNNGPLSETVSKVVALTIADWPQETL